MTAILLALIIMAASILLIRALCQRIGIRVRLSSLLLCAVLSVLVTVLAIETSTVLDQYQYMRLAGLSLLSALIVTRFNERQLRREERASAAWPSAPLPWEEPVSEPCAPKEARAQGEESSQEEPAPAVPALPDSNRQEGAEDEPAKEAVLPHEPPAFPVSEDSIAAIASMESLDDLLSYAYAQKADAPGVAVAAYRAAIERYPNDDYAPFLIIELAGLYKEHAAYQEAIRLYAKALTLPSVAGHDAMQREFIKSLRYLGTVQDILSKHNAPDMPFPDLPKELLDEIEIEFTRQGEARA